MLNVQLPIASGAVKMFISQDQLNDYYRGLGFFDVDIKHENAFSSDKSKVYLKYNISEGPRYRIRQTIIQGNNIFTEEQLRQELADLAVMAAGRIVKKELDPAAQSTLIEQVLSEASVPAGERG